MAAKNQVAGSPARSRFRSTVGTVAAWSLAWLFFAFLTGAHSRGATVWDLGGIFSSWVMFLGVMICGSIHLAAYCAIGLLAWGLTGRPGVGAAVAAGAALLDMTLTNLQVLLHVLFLRTLARLIGGT